MGQVLGLGQRHTGLGLGLGQYLGQGQYLGLVLGLVPGFGLFLGLCLGLVPSLGPGQCQGFSRAIGQGLINFLKKKEPSQFFKKNVDVKQKLVKITAIKPL